MSVDSKLIYKVLIIAVPTYLVAFSTEAMVYTMPMLAITTVIATSLFNDNRGNVDVDTDYKEDIDGE